MEVQCRKEYVSVNLDVDQNGVVHPPVHPLGKWPYLSN